MESRFIRSGAAGPLHIAGRNDPVPRPPISGKRIVGLSILGSVTTVLIVLAARPSPVESVEARVDAAIALYAKADRAGAMEAARALVKSDPSEPRAWLLLGMLDEDRKAIKEAEHDYTIALNLLEPDDARRTDVEVTLVDLLRRKGDPEGALSAIDKLARLRGESPRLRHARALALIDLRRFEDALSETRAIAEEKFGVGVAKKLEKHIRSSMAAAESRDG